MNILRSGFLRGSGFRRGWLALALVGVIAAGGCASANKTVTHKDLRTLRPGITRADVLREFGRPLSATTSTAGLPVDIFRFVQDTNTHDDIPQPIEASEADAQAVKILMAQTGIMPEKMLDGQTLTVQVNYDADSVVVDSYMLAIKK